MLAEPVPADAERLSIAQRSALAFLTLYKVLLSPLFAGSCRFLPSCSDYAREAVTIHGTVKGTWLAVRRLSRCHPFGWSGFDPVPGRSRLTSRGAPPQTAEGSASRVDKLDHAGLTRGSAQKSAHGGFQAARTASTENLTQALGIESVKASGRMF